MKKSELLRAARAKIDTPDKWCTEFYGADGEERHTLIVDDAIAFCMVGALRAAAGYARFDRSHPTELWLDMAVEKYQVANGVDVDNVDPDVTIFNDHSTHAEVLAAYDFAIKLAEEEEATLETAD